MWTSATALLFLGLVMMGTKIWAGVHFDEAPPDSVPSKLWPNSSPWSSATPGPDGKFGHTDLKWSTIPRQPVRLDDQDPAGKDDIVSASLKVPVGKSHPLIMHSRDVIHNFFVRELRMKQDIVPGMEIPLHFQADKIGVYEVPCSELCGLGHFQMRTTMQVMSHGGFRAVEAVDASSEIMPVPKDRRSSGRQILQRRAYVRLP